MNKKGITLFALIMMIVLLGIFVSGIVVYITEGLRLNAANINKEKALYMAQAGIMSGLVDYIADGVLETQSNINVNSPSEFFYSVGGSSSFLLIDGSNLRANGRVVNTWSLKNISSATTITINSVVVEWDFVSNLNSMKIGNNYIIKGVALSSPTTINAVNCYSGSIPLSIPGNTNYNGTNDQYIQFSSNVPTNLTVSVTFNFSDGSSLKRVLVKGGKVTNNEFFINATGKIGTSATAEARRTLKATYDITTNKITSWDETTRHIIP